MYRVVYRSSRCGRRILSLAAVCMGKWCLVDDDRVMFEGPDDGLRTLPRTIRRCENI